MRISCLTNGPFGTNCYILEGDEVVLIDAPAPAGRIIERLKAERPDRKIILTFFSPSGYEMRKNYPLADIVAYLPFATRKNARRFVEMVRPEKAIFIKYEFWPNYLKCLQQHNVPVYSIAAIFNPKQAFFRWYGGSYRKCLRCFTHLFVQDEASARLLARYRIGNTTVCGDPRFDRVVAIAAEAKEFPLVQKFVQDSTNKLPPKELYEIQLP